jgi:hypothetical protein
MKIRVLLIGSNFPMWTDSVNRIPKKNAPISNPVTKDIFTVRLTMVKNDGIVNVYVD